MIKLTMRLLAVALVLALPQLASAQTPPPSQPASAPPQQLLAAGQLDALVAPIALYPDALLSEILMASTYPLEVVEADRWVGCQQESAGRCAQGRARPAELGRQHKVARGDARRARHDEPTNSTGRSSSATRCWRSSPTSWTPSSGCASKRKPTTSCSRPASRPCRRKARAAGSTSTSHRPTRTRSTCRITIRPWSTGRGTIRTIRPITGRRRPISASAFSRPGWRSAPATRSGAGPRAAIAGAAASIGAATTSTSTARLNVNNFNGNNWSHNPAHRGNVGYNNPGVAAKFGGNTARGGGTQLNGRGSGGQQVLQPRRRQPLESGRRRCRRGSRRRRQSHDRQRAHGQ